MLNRKTLGFLCAALLGLMLFDIASDSAGCPDPGGPATVCHACSCPAHIVSPNVIETAAAPVSATFVVYEPVAYDAVPIESPFHPPRRAA